tara:strand:- start:70 stop:1479 length:1410 start_codon:yes stop_codon:yes gene_type:complete
MSAAVGDIEEQEVTVENPSGVPLELRASVSNRRNFSVRPSTLELPPYGQGVFILRYTPATIDKEEDVVVTLSAPSVGEWVYMATGRGMVPGTMPLVTPMAVVHERASHTLVFRNPFDSPLTVSTELDYSEAAGAVRPFELLMRRSRTKLPPFGAMQVPYVFSPMEMTEYEGTAIIVRSQAFEGSERQLTWRYPLLGVAEAPPHARRIEIVTKAREPMSRTVVLPLAGLKPNEDGVAETFTFELLSDALDSSENGPLLKRSLFLEALDMTVDASTAESGNASVKLRAQFEPLRPFSLSVELLVRKASGGGLWRFTLWIEAKQPDVDDTITLEGMLHQTSSVAFTLDNPFPESAPFKAFLTADSPSELTIFPQEGYLQPANAEDPAQFIVSFTPTEYGKMFVGRLVVLTELMQWTFEVRGTHASYTAPDATQIRSRIDNRLAKKTQKASKRARAPRKRNMVKANIRSLRDN